MSSAGRAAVRLAGARLEVPGPVGADRVGLPPRLRRRPQTGEPTEVVGDGDQRRGRLARATSAAASASRWSRRARSAPTPGRCSGRCRGSCGAASSRDEIDDERRLLQALNCLLIETPAGRVLVETGIGERLDDKTRTMRGYEGPCDRAGARGGRVRARDRRRRGDEPPPLRPRRRPAARRRLAGLPARDDRRPEGRMGGRARRQPAAGRVVRPAGARARPRLGRRGLGRRRARDPARACRSCPTGGHSAGHQAIVVRGAGSGAGPWPSSATCSCGRGRPTRAG